MSLLCRRLFPLLGVTLLLSHGVQRDLHGAGEATVLRYLEFRDGSILQLPVVDEERTIHFLRPDGQIGEKTVRWSAFQRVTLTPERVFPRKRRVLELVQQMGADEFAAREKAHAELARMGPSIRADLETALELFTDIEIKDRLKRILAAFPPPDPKADKGEPLFDSLEFKETLWGDAGAEGIPVRVDGQTRRLSRRDVLGMSVRAPEFAALDSFRPVTGGFSRIKENEFPRGCLEEPFETAADGRVLKPGENIEKLFIPKGFTLATSIKTSFVSVNSYRVEGKSKGLSAATHQPLFEGEITIRFCRPGRENVPAGVTHFGCWIAAVVPKGTELVGYDLRGRELGRIHTVGGPNEFLGIRSSVPMHTIKVVPNVNIDRDYTLDDFIYTPPLDAELAHPTLYRAHFADGERVLCNDVSFSPRGIELHGLVAGLPDRSRPLADLLRLTTPGKGKPEQLPAMGVYIELKDGSVLYGDRPAAGPPVFGRRPEVLKQAAEVAELWSAGTVRLLAPAKFDAPIVWDAKVKAWQKVYNARLNEENVQWKSVGGDEQKLSYFTVGQLVLGKPAVDPVPGTWHVRTIQGDDLVLSANAPPNLSGRLSKEMTASWAGKWVLKIPAADLVSVYRVSRSP